MSLLIKRIILSHPLYAHPLFGFLTNYASWPIFIPLNSYYIIGIFFCCYPSKVFNVIICSHAIYVVYKRFVIYVRNKRFGNKSMYKHLLAFFVFI